MEQITNPLIALVIALVISFAMTFVALHFEYKRHRKEVCALLKLVMQRECESKLDYLQSILECLEKLQHETEALGHEHAANIALKGLIESIGNQIALDMSMSAIVSKQHSQ